MQLYGKSYETEIEEKLREHIYKSNLQYIKEFNAEGHSWTLGVNECVLPVLWTPESGPHVFLLQTLT